MALHYAKMLHHSISFDKSSKVNKFVINKNLKYWPNSQQKKKMKFHLKP